MRYTTRNLDSNSVLPKSLQTRKGWSRLLDMKRTVEPHLHQIEPTNHCIYSCVMCPRRKMTREVGFMEMDVYKKVIDEVATFEETTRLKDIELFHFGESLFHPKLCEMIGYAADLNLNTVLSVNAPQLTNELIEDILANRPSTIILSLDGGGQESYSRARGPNADYESAERHIDRLINIHHKMNSSCTLVLRMIMMRSHEKLGPNFEAKWKSKGVEIDLREFFPWGDKEMQHLGDYRRYPAGMPCPFPWQYAVVQWNGDVVPCCRDYNAVNKMGNIKDATLKEIWNSDTYEQFREQHRTGNYLDNETCAECMSLYYTEEKR